MTNIGPLNLEEKTRLNPGGWQQKHLSLYEYKNGHLIRIGRVDVNPAINWLFNDTIVSADEYGTL